jgi:MmeI, N-terminal domain
MNAPPDISADKIEAFIARWQGQEGGQERANYALFLIQLCDLLGLPHPDPAGASHERNDYVFERVVTHHHEDGDAIGRIDLHRRNSFVLEAKQSRWKGGKKEIAGQSDLFTAEKDLSDRGRAGAQRNWDVLMINAKRQAEEYARALPTSHGWPPFILVCDVGHCIEIYADFTGQGKNYTQFPDRQSFRVYLEDLCKPEIRERLKTIWLDPQSLDPTRKAAKATREIAARLAEVF